MDPKERSCERCRRRSSDPFNLEVDGDFRSRTEKAVREFQRSNGLGVDGVVGPRTAARLGIDLADEGVAGVTDNCVAPQRRPIPVE